ncbi:hypothetical protein ACFC26_07705 [Kitasatospora purpeofusca]|uniref:hypothetical protein n=1 Tax=Kitasatospora purpeofusca TaxID=67352 RepID=UPI0035E164A8
MTDRIQRTTVLLRRIEDGQAVYKTIHCADAPTAENRYERTRPNRPPASERGQFQAKQPPGTDP